MRACQPTVEGVVERDGVAVRFERYGEGEPAILLLPTWTLVHARHWKMQIAYLARHFSALCFDGPGNGGSYASTEPAAYSDVAYARNAVAVLDAAEVDKAVLVGLSCAASWGLRLRAEHPGRVLGAVFIAPAVPLMPRLPERRVQRFDAVFDDPVDWEKYNAHHWKTDYPDFVRFLMGRIFTEPHSTKQIEDATGWALETDGETLVASDLGLLGFDERTTRKLAARGTCPVLVIHGSDDAVRGHGEGAALAELTGGELVTIAGGGHFPHTRDPVRVNMLIKQFADGVAR